MVCVILRSRRGAVLVFAAICALVLLGVTALVVDVGRLYVAKQRAQNVADAGALAGCVKLDGTPSCKPAATAEAQDIGTRNNDKMPSWIVEPTGEGNPVTVTFPSGLITQADGSTVTVSEGEAVRVDCRARVTFGFGRIFGLTNGSAIGTAIALRKAVSHLTYNLVPWCVSDTTLWQADPQTGELQPKLAVGTSTTLKITNPKDPSNFLGPGNFLAIAYNGESGGNTYRDRIAGLLPPVTVSTGDVVDLNVDTEPGNKMGPTYQGIKERIGNDSWTFDSWESQGEVTGVYPDTPRIIVVPIIADPLNPLNGRDALEVVGFAAFFLEDYNKQQETVTGRFITALNTGGQLLWGLDTPNIGAPTGTTLVTRVSLVF